MMQREEILSFLGKDWTGVTEHIHKALLTDVSFLSGINSSLVSHSGKLFRPIMSILIARACNSGMCTQDSLRFAAAAELLHNATLLHDDVADDSPTRRGIPTLYSSLGAAPAVLVGDFWLSRTIGLILDAKRSDKVVRLYAKTLTDLAEGEMLQLGKAVEADTEEEDYLKIIYCKTASLFEAASVSAAISVDAPSEYVEAMKSFGIALGYAFQIKDDILDYEGGLEMGKPLGADLKEGKITLPLLKALEGYPEQKEIRKLLRNAANDTAVCGRIVAFVKERGGIEKAKKVLAAYVEKACRALDVLPASEERNLLTALASYTASRNI